MVQGFYTLEEAAGVLGMAPEELNRMAQKREIRAFADRGTWRFRTQDVEELSKRRAGGGAAAAEPFAGGEEPSSSAPTRNLAKSSPAAEDTFGFSLTPDENVEIGQEILPDPSSSSKSGKKKKSSGVLTPPAKSPSDSGRLASGSDDFDAPIKLVDDLPLTPPSSKSGAKKRSGIAPPDAPAPSKPSSGRKTGIPAASRQDTGVRQAPLPDDDNEVRLDFDSPAKSDDDSFVTVGDNLPKAPGDSDVRLSPLDEPSFAPEDQPNLESMRTEEMIDLDAELRKADEFAQQKPSSNVKRSSKLKPGSGVKSKTKPPELPTTSPFELSDDDLDINAPAGAGLSGSEFDLAAPDLGDAHEMKLKEDNQGIELDALNFGGADLKSGRRPGKSGISMQSPTDSGISLDSDSDSSTEEVDFELSLDADDSLAGPKTGPKGGPAHAEQGTDSEFELTIDEEGDLSAAGRAGASTEEEKDIFETDFELPALEEESGSQAVALEPPDTDLESSDFDLALDDADVTADDESGSAVVVLDEEDSSGEGPPTITRKRGAGDAAAAAEDDEGSFDDLLSQDELGQVEAEAEEEDEEELVAAAPAADWGTLPTLLMLPCAILMILVGLMSYELLHSMWGYHQPNKASGLVVRNLASLFGYDLPTD